MLCYVKLILVVSCCVIGTESSQLHCIDQRNETQKFVLTSERNTTGHWIAKLHVVHGGPERDRGEGPVEVQLEHNTAACVTETSQEVDVQISSHPPITPSPGPDYYFFPKFGYYKRHTEMKSWEDARAECENEGSHLLIINSVDEALVVLQLFGRLLLHQPRKVWDREAWVGITDLKEEGNYETVSGLPLSATGYEMWGPGEPNDHKGEDCIAVLKNGLYNDRDCNGVLEFICELEY